MWEKRMVKVHEVDHFNNIMNPKKILEEKLESFTQENRRKEVTQETVLLQEFIVHLPKLGMVDFQEIKRQKL